MAWPGRGENSSLGEKIAVTGCWTLLEGREGDEPASECGSSSVKVCGVA